MADHKFDLTQPMQPISDWELANEVPSRVFLNHGSFGAPPKKVLAAQSSWRAHVESFPDRFYDGELQLLWRRQRDVAAEFVGAPKDDVVLVPNATFGNSSVLHSIDWQPGDEVVFTDQLYASVRAYLQLLPARGVVLREVPIPFPLAADGAADIVESIARSLSPRTRLLVIDHIASPTALVMPVENLIHLAKSHGCAILIDGAHAPGQVPLLLQKWQPDYYVGNCHKWLFAPRSAAFLYVRNFRDSSVRPPIIGNFFHDGFASAFAWLGTFDVTPLLCIENGINYWRSLGGHELEMRNHKLAQYGRQKVCDALSASPPHPDTSDYYASMFAVPLPTGKLTSKVSAQAWRQRFRDEFGISINVAVHAGQLWLRCCAQAYNCAQDFDRLAAVLVELDFKSGCPVV